MHRKNNPRSVPLNKENKYIHVQNYQCQCNIGKDYRLEESMITGCCSSMRNKRCKRRILSPII